MKAGAVTLPWICPNCSRTFSSTDQPHYCGTPRTVDEYIDAQDESVRPRLREVRKIIRTAIPEAQECISWAMPTYRRGKDNVIHFAASKKHLGIYPGSEATQAFREELSGLSVSKGTIRLPYGEKLPADLIGRIARWCFRRSEK